MNDLDKAVEEILQKYDNIHRVRCPRCSTLNFNTWDYCIKCGKELLEAESES